MLDSARMNSELSTARELNPEHTCLYEGDSERFLGVVAPWLFNFIEGTDFSSWLSENAHANNWGIFIRSDEEPIKIYKHLRKFLIVATEDGKELYFRFYDPRVLRVFLPTCDKDQLREFFGPIQAFIAEVENGLLVEYALNKEQLEFSDIGQDMVRYFNDSGNPRVRADQLPAENSFPDPHQGSVESDSKSGVSENKDGEAGDGKSRSPGWDFGF